MPKTLPGSLSWPLVRSLRIRVDNNPHRPHDGFAMKNIVPFVPSPSASNILAAAKAAGVKGTYIKSVGRKYRREERSYQVTTTNCAGTVGVYEYKITAFPAEHA